MLLAMVTDARSLCALGFPASTAELLLDNWWHSTLLPWASASHRSFSWFVSDGLMGQN